MCWHKQKLEKGGLWLLHRKMCNMRFLKRMLRLTHGKHANQVTYLKRMFINAHFTYVKYRT